MLACANHFNQSSTSLSKTGSASRGRHPSMLDGRGWRMSIIWYDVHSQRSDISDDVHSENSDMRYDVHPQRSDMWYDVHAADRMPLSREMRAVRSVGFESLLLLPRIPSLTSRTIRNYITEYPPVRDWRHYDRNTTAYRYDRFGFRRTFSDRFSNKKLAAFNFPEPKPFL
jgi:hypothetical protein